jgi:2-iminobutanoate/2-iminopropanoate deaminase
MMTQKECISTELAPAAVGPYSQAVRTGKLVFTAGQIGLKPDTKSLAGPDIESQTRQVLENLQAILRAAGSSLEQAVKTTVFLADIDEFPDMNAVYAQYFPAAPPARSAAQAVALPLGARVMIEAIARVSDEALEETTADDT